MPEHRTPPPFRLPDLTYPLSVDTIGKILAMGSEMSASCHTYGCNHHARINLVMLARRLGMDHPCMASHLLPHLYCSKCREAGRPDRNISLTIHVCTDPHSRWPREANAYEKAKEGR